MEVISRVAKSLTGDVGTLKLPSMTWTAAEVWCSSWLASCSSWEGAQAQLNHEHVLLSGGVFSTKKRPRHVQRQHCACETPTMLQEGSTIGFTFSLSVCTSQSNTLSFNDSQRYFLLLSSHEKWTKKPVKPRAFSFPLPPFLQSPYTNLPCRNCQHFQQISHCPSVAIHSRI